MKLSNVNEWFQLVANVGVILGLLVLAWEISQNNELLKLNAMQSVASSSSTLTSDAANGDHVVPVLAKVRRGDILSDEEKTRHDLYRLAAVRNFESYFYQWQTGYLSDEFFDSRARSFGNLFANDSEKRWWSQFKESFSIEFQQYVEQSYLK